MAPTAHCLEDALTSRSTLLLQWQGHSRGPDGFIFPFACSGLLTGIQVGGIQVCNALSLQHFCMTLEKGAREISPPSQSSVRPLGWGVSISPFQLSGFVNRVKAVLMPVLMPGVSPCSYQLPYSLTKCPWSVCHWGPFQLSAWRGQACSSEFRPSALSTPSRGTAFPHWPSLQPCPQDGLLPRPPMGFSLSGWPRGVGEERGEAMLVGRLYTSRVVDIHVTKQDEKLPFWLG